MPLSPSDPDSGRPGSFVDLESGRASSSPHCPGVYGTSYLAGLPEPIPINRLNESQDPVAVTKTGRQPQVLVVEDEPAVLEMLAIALRFHGFSVLAAQGGKSAIEMYAQNHAQIDAVLLDVQMPEMDGPQTLTLLQAIDSTIRCIFMSAHTGKYCPDELLAMGAIGILSKPFTKLTDVVNVLRACA